MASITFTTKKFFASCFYMGLVSFSNVYLNETIMTKTLAQTFPVAVVIETGFPVSITGKFETLGSNFSNETRQCEAACDVATNKKSELEFLSTSRT